VATRHEIRVQLEQHVGKVAVAVTLHIAANLVAAPSEGGTPVDTGWARANWVPAIGRAFEGVAGSRTNVSSGAQSAGQASLLSYRIAMGPIYVSNNVPYILALNDGHSPQAAAHFIERAIDKAVLEDIRGFAA